MSRYLRNPLRLASQRSLENPQIPLSEALSDDSIADAFMGGGRSSSGMRITNQSALTYAAFWRGVNLVSGDLAKMPLRLFRRGANDSRELAIDHPAYQLVRRRPNDYMTSFVFKQTMTAHVITQGNAYAYIIRNGDAEPIELLPLMPHETWPVRVNGVLWYTTKVGTEVSKIAASDMLHLKGLGYDGLCGYNVIAKARESLGGAMAVDRFASMFFKNGVRASGVLMYPGRMKENAVNQLRKDWDRLQTGLTNAHRLVILQDGVKYQQLTIAPEDAQMLQTRQHGPREVANWLGIPSHKLGDKEGQAYNSLEQENQSYLDEGVDPRAVVWEEELGEKLLTEEEKATDSHYFAFERKSLVRADMAARGQFYQGALQNRWMTPDEVRAREDMNPLPSGQGSNLLPAPNASLKQEQKMRRSVELFLSDALERMAKRIATHVARAAKQQSADFAAVLSEHRDVIVEAIRPAFDSSRDAQRAADSFLAAILADLDQIERKDDFIGPIGVVMARFSTEQPRKLAAEFLKENR